MTQEAAQETKPRRRGRKPRGVSMNRCSECRTFVSLEPGEPEDDGLEVTAGDDIFGDGSQEVQLSGSVRLTLKCGNCAQELAETTLAFDQQYELVHTDDCEEPEFEFSTPEIEASEDVTGGGMYSKHFYGALVSFEAECKTCGAKLTGEADVHEQASSFEVMG